MTMFHEMYGAYFRIAARVLGTETITEKALRAIVAEEGFRESVLFVPQKLIPVQGDSEWGLLRNNPDGTFSRVLNHAPQMPLTLLQKRWLKAKLRDPKMQLFLEDETLDALETALHDVKPLWQPEAFRCTDQFADGDDFGAYRALFRQLMQAIRCGEVLMIRYRTGRGQRTEQRYLPLALEYSGKNDKFRLCCRGMRGDRPAGCGIINLGRIETVRGTGYLLLERRALEPFFASRRCKEPAIIRLTPKRNAVDRFMTEFASYQKHTKRDLKSGECTVQLWYDKQDETELLIQLLSFGPVLEILGPPEFRKQAAERVAAQYALLFP